MTIAVRAWIARFDDGPAGGDERVFVVGPIWQRMEVAPIRQETHGWSIVGGDGVGGPAEHRWPGQVNYWLRYVEHLGDEPPIAHYSSAGASS